MFLMDRISFSAVFFFISVYFAVSIAEYFAAFLEGLLMLKNTVINTKIIVKIKIAGCTDCTMVISSSLYSQFFRITGNKSTPSPYPRSKPTGIPIRDKRNICLLIGSSAKTISGFVIIALAMATLCCCPPDKVFGKFFSLFLIPRISTISSKYTSSILLFPR